MTSRRASAALAFGVALLFTGPASAQAPDAGVEQAPDVDGGAAPDAGASVEEETPDAGAEAPHSQPDDDVEPEDETEDAGEVDEAELDDLFTLTEEDVEAVEPGQAEAEELPDELFTVPELEIAYTPEDIFRMGGSAQLLSQEQLEALDIEDPNQLLLQVPGVYVRQEDGYGLRPNIGIRGVSSDRSKKITLMEDAVLFAPAPYSAPAAYYFPLMSRVVGVEVFKGPAAVLYGPNTIGGAINFLSREIPEDEAEGELDVSLGRFFDRRFHAWYGASNDWGGFLLEGVTLGSDGFKELDLPPGFGDDDTGFSRTEIVFRGRLQTDPAEDTFQRFELKLGYSRERSNETYLGLSDPDFEANADRRYAASQLDRMQWWRTSATLFHTLAVGDHFELRSAVYRHDFDRTWRRLNRFRDGPELLDVLSSPSGLRQVFYEVLTGARDSGSVEDPTQDQDDLLIVSNARRMFSQGVQTRARFDFETGPVEHEVEVGIRLHHDGIERDHVEDGFVMQSGQLVADGRAPIPVTASDAWTLAIAGYFVYGLTFHGVTLSPGLRVEGIHGELDDALSAMSSDNDDVVLIPGFGALYAFTDTFAALAGVHRGFSPVAPGQPDEVEPELSVNYEVGVRYSDPDEERLAELVFFFNDYTNLTGTCGGSAGCAPELLDRQFNGGDVHVLGAELAAVHSFDLGRGYSIPLRGSYTFTYGTFASDFDSPNPQFGMVEDGDEVPYVPQHQAQLQAGIEKEDLFSVRVSVTYVGEMREEAGQGDPGPGELPMTDDYVLLDVTGSYELIDGLEVYLKLDNIFNARPIVARRPFGARPNRPIGGHVGLRAEL